jgi:hypothetical protein
MLLRFLLRYIAFVGLVANLAVMVFFAFWAVNKVAGSEAYRDLRRLVLGSSDGVEVTSVQPVAPGQLNPGLLDLPVGAWAKIHEQTSDEPEAFVRQAHGGAAFDQVRGRVMLFGSNTHGRNWDNTVRFFDMGTLRWSSAYAPDPPDTYRVTAAGIPVAGVEGDRPWAMHTFDAVEFDPITDRLIIASSPAHLSPSWYEGMDPSLWGSIRNHPTWAYHVGENRWEPLVEKGQSFFPYGATFDPIRRNVVGVNPGGYWELSVDKAEWRRVARGGSPPGWHNSAAFDIEAETVISFGTHTRSNEVWQYRIGDEQGRVMPTPGIRPPGADSAPLVYHPRIKKVVGLVERGRKGETGTTETWLYSTIADTWEQLPSATIPYGVGMNYSMVYDPNHRLLVLISNYPAEPTAVWALRL